MRQAAPWVVLLLVVVLAGCAEPEPSRVPDRLLEGPGGNGWEKNLTSSARGAQRDGTARAMTLVYEDRGSGDGYPGSLTVTTLSGLVRPTEGRVREVVEDRIREDAESRGIDVEPLAAGGTRRLANGMDSEWFVYNGSVQAAGSLFQSRNARVKIFGEVFECVPQKSVVVIVGLAQTTDVRSVGGVPLPSEADPTTWREIAADPRGHIEGIRGSDGLAYGVTC